MESRTARPEGRGAAHRSRSFLRRGRFLVAGVILAGALGYLIYAGVQTASMYYLSVGELAARGEAAYADDVRLGGTVMEGSVRQDTSTMVVDFVVTDGQQSLPVRYTGVLPDAFKAGTEVVAEGRLAPSGVFEASTLLAKCPSKYEPAQPEAS